MTALRLVGTTSERESNLTRGGAGRATGRAQPGSVESSEGETGTGRLFDPHFLCSAQRVESRPGKPGRLVL